MRIIAGKFKFFPIQTSKKLSFSPISSYLRENIFNILETYLSWEKQTTLDLFAGTGSLGLEALSRSSKFVSFNDIDRKNIDLLDDVLKTKLKVKNASLHNLPYKQFLLQMAQTNKKIDLIFLDPPFDSPEMITESANFLAKNQLIALNGIVVIISSQPIRLDKKEWILLQEKNYNKKFVLFWKFNKDLAKNLNQKKTKFLAISGPSGVGKSKIIKLLLQDSSLNLAYSVSYTTRKPRAQEKRDQHYFFIDQKKFQKKINENEFLEFVQFADYYYGTSKEKTKKLVAQNKNILFEVEIEGAESLQKQLPLFYWIYIFPPSIDVLRSRLLMRKTENEEKVEKRLQKANKELAYMRLHNSFDFCVINNEIEKSVQEIKNFLLKKGFAKKN